MSEAPKNLSAGIGASASERWRKTLLPVDATLKAAIQNLDASALQIALVVAPSGALVGTITDGDIRRGLLRALDLGSPITSIIKREPLVVPPQMPDEMVRQLMTSNHVRQLPIVASDGTVTGLHLWDALTSSSELPNLMVIMAGGKGLRLRPHTDNCPKPLLPVRGKPMIEHIIVRARDEGFHRFFIAVHYLGEMIKSYCGNGKKWGIRIDYLDEKAPLGTAGALRLIDPIPSAPFVVTNGDVLSEVRYRELLEYHQRHEASATMAVRLHEWHHPFGVVRTDGVNITGFEEKPISRSQINAGIYVLTSAALDVIKWEEPCDMPTIFSRLHATSAKTIVYPIHEPWLDMGDSKEYLSNRAVSEPA